MHITLRANEKIYINGAVLKPDRKVSIELLNDAVFLLQAHVMTEAEATTPMRQLYYIVQLMLMDPNDLAINQTVFNQQSRAMAAVYKDMTILDGLAKISALVGRKRHFEALKVIRSLLPVDTDCGDLFILCEEWRGLFTNSYDSRLRFDLVHQI